VISIAIKLSFCPLKEAT